MTPFPHPGQRIDGERAEPTAVQRIVESLQPVIGGRQYPPVFIRHPPQRLGGGTAAGERRHHLLFLLHTGHARRHRQPQDVGAGPPVGVRDPGDVLAHRSGHHHLGAEHAFQIAQRRGRRIAVVGPFPDHAVDAPAAEPDTDQNAGADRFRLPFVDQVVEGLAQMGGLHIEHHPGDRTLRRGGPFRRRALAALARRQAVKRQLFGVRCTHALQSNAATMRMRLMTYRMAARSASTRFTRSQVKSASSRPKWP